MAMIADQLTTPSLRPNAAVLIGGTAAATLLSFIFFPWPLAIASSLLGLLMVAGADVDARCFLLPDAVTYGAVVAGVLAAPFLDTLDSWQSPGLGENLGFAQSIGVAILRAAGMALVLYLLRLAYARLRQTEGLGLGDVKLAAAAGAWLPLQAIPICFALATTAALLTVLVKRRDEAMGELKLPLGAFLCPAIWLIFFANHLGPG